MERKISPEEPEKIRDAKREISNLLLDAIKTFDDKTQMDECDKAHVTIIALGELLVRLNIDMGKSLGMSKKDLEERWSILAKIVDDSGREYIKEVFDEEQTDE